MAVGRIHVTDRKRMLEEIFAQDAGRKQTQRWLWELMRKRFRDQVVRRIRTALPDPIISGQVIANARTSPNVFLDVTGKLAVVYKHGVTRIVGIDTGDPEANAAVVKVEDMTGQRTRSPTWNRRAWGLGPIWVYPTVRPGSVRYHQMSPHQLSITRDGSTGETSAIGWRTGPKREIAVIVDELTWQYFNRRGERVRGPEGELEVEHGIVDFASEPTVPGSWLRLDDADDEDFWWVDRHDDLRDVTLYSIMMMSLKSWIRNTQNRKIPVMKGRTDKVAKKQAMGSNAALNINTRTPGEVMIEIHDINSSVEQFHRDIAFEVERVVETYGIPGQAVTYDFDSGAEAERLTVQHDALSQVRQEQVEYVVRFEKRLLHVMAQVLERGAHPLASDLDPDAIAESFHMEVPPLSRVDDPMKIEQWRALVRKRAGKSEIDFIQDDHPGMSREEAMIRMERVVTDRSKLADELAKHSMTMGPDGILTTPELAGAMGTPAREANKDNPDA